MKSNKFHYVFVNRFPLNSSPKHSVRSGFSQGSPSVASSTSTLLRSSSVSQTRGSPFSSNHAMPGSPLTSHNTSSAASAEGTEEVSWRSRTFLQAIIKSLFYRSKLKGRIEWFKLFLDHLWSMAEHEWPWCSLSDVIITNTGKTFSITPPSRPLISYPLLSNFIYNGVK